MAEAEISVSSGLEQILVAALGTVRVERLVRLTAGANRETWSFDAIDESGSAHQLILQRDRAGTEMGAGTCAREATVLRHAAAGGVPVAEVVLAADPPNPLDRSFTINRRLEGETIARRILRDEQWVGARSAFVGQCGVALAAVHRLDPAPLEADLTRVDDELDLQRQAYDSVEDPHPVFEFAFRWLELHRPPKRPPTVVHGDFRLGNLMLDETGLVAALDWEGAHIGNPVQDLAWLCVPAWRFGGPKPVGGIGDYQELLDAYAAAGGVDISIEELHWWETFGMLRWGVLCMQMSNEHRTGASPSMELAAIGRRVVENECDLLMALAGPTPMDRDEPAPRSTVPAHASRPPRTNWPHDTPDARELVDAVRDYLATDLGPRSQGADRWMLRIAANALTIAERELRLGNAHRTRHHDSLEALGHTDDATLGAAIRGGEFDERDEELRTSLWSTVRDKLAVANPSYRTSE